MELVKSTGGGPKDLFTGFFSGSVLAINPTKEEVAELLGFEVTGETKDQVYEGKTEKGDDFVSISIWLKAEQTTLECKPFNVRFRIVNKPVVSETSGKKQFVNQNGMSTWVDSEDNLPGWFTEYRDKNNNLILKDKDGELTGSKKVRESIQGEADLYTFLKAWLGKANFFSERTNIFIDVNKMFRNFDKYIDDQYRSQLRAGDDAMITNVGALAFVGIVEKDGETKMYQNLYKEFLSNFQMKKINFAVSTGNWEADKGIKKWHEQATGKYGVSGAYTFTMLQAFDPNNYQQASDEIITEVTNADDIDF